MGKKVEPPVDPRKLLEDKAKAKATEKWDDGNGELPPGWDYDTTEDGEYYYIKPDGDTQWEDPRADFESYWKEFVAAADRGVDLDTV